MIEFCIWSNALKSFKQAHKYSSDYFFIHWFYYWFNKIYDGCNSWFIFSKAMLSLIIKNTVLDSSLNANALHFQRFLTLREKMRLDDSYWYRFRLLFYTLVLSLKFYLFRENTGYKWCVNQMQHGLEQSLLRKLNN